MFDSVSVQTAREAMSRLTDMGPEEILKFEKAWGQLYRRRDLTPEEVKECVDSEKTVREEIRRRLQIAETFKGGRPTFTEADERTISEVATVHAKDPLSSFVASDHAVNSGNKVKQCKVVYDLVRQCEGLTSRELVEISPYDDDDKVYKIRRSLHVLMKAGKLRKGDERKCRVAGTLQATWYLA